MIFDLGPFCLSRATDGGLSITLKYLGDYPFGWEYGYRDVLRGQDEPVIEIRIGKLMLFYFEFHQKGVEIWFMGFWAFLSWGN